MKSVFVFLLSLTLGGCQTLVKTIYGAKKPAALTSQDIRRWLQREGLHPQHLASVRPEAFQQVFMTYADGLKVFSANGAFIPIGYRYGKYCPQGLYAILASLKPTRAGVVAAPAYGFAHAAIPAVTPLHLNFLLSQLRTLDGAVIPAFPEDVDFIVLIPFALWMGRRFQTRDMRSVVKAMSHNPHARFSIWYINLDKQAWWGEDWNSKIIVQ